MKKIFTKKGLTASLVALAPFAGAIAARADAVTVPTVDYSDVTTAVSTYASSTLSSNAPTIVIVTVLFSGFMWLRSMLKKSAAGR